MDEDEDRILGLVFELDEDDVEHAEAVAIRHTDGTLTIIPEHVLRAFGVTDEGRELAEQLIEDSGAATEWSAVAAVQVDWVPPHNLPELGGDPEPPACSNTGILLRPPIPTVGWPITPAVNLPTPIIIPPRPWPPPPPGPMERGPSQT